MVRVRIDKKLCAFLSSPIRQARITRMPISTAIGHERVSRQSTSGAMPFGYCTCSGFQGEGTPYFIIRPRFG
jgi:hypothetical protein